MPAIVTSSLKEKAALVSVKTKEILAPAPSATIAGHITVLLRHYYHDAKLPADVMEGLALQWIKTLEDFPAWAVEKAVIEYLRDDAKGRKPVPGQIVALSRKAVAKYTALLWQCRRIEDAAITPPPPPELSEEEKEAQRAEVSRICAEARRKLSMGEDIKHGK